MASEQSMVEYICEQMQGAGNVTHRKMFGEYGVYLDATFIGAICDNTLFLKVTKQARELEPQLELAPAYKGAKLSFRISTGMLEDPERLAGLIRVIHRTLPNKKA